MPRNNKELKVEWGNVTEKNVKQLKVLNSVCFPVKYPESFYQNIIRNVLRSNEEYTKFAYYNDVLVGAVCCRLEKKSETSNELKLYIMTLGVLNAYRSYGIGNQLIQHVLKWCENNKIDEVYLHVQTSNEVAIGFYKKYGFEIIETVKGYYKKISPPDCYVVQKRLQFGAKTTEAPKS